MRRSHAHRCALVPFAAALVFAAAAGAGDYHTGATLICSDCHVMHGSAGHAYESGGPLEPAIPPGGPRSFLLKALGSELCLSCHDGRTDTPDVYAADSGSKTRLAGAVTREGDTGSYAQANGHSLGSSAQAPGGSWVPGAGGLGCTDCHDSHGNASYRNLRPDRGGAAVLAVSYATSGSWQASKMVLQAAKGADHYDVSNVRYGTEAGKTLSDWCAGCHVTIHGVPPSADMGGSTVGDVPGTSGDEWLQHPTGGVNMRTGANNGRVDATHWWLTGLAPAPQSRVPVVTTAGTVPADDNQPFCGSCHKAHGSSHKAGLLFDNDQTSAAEDGTKPLETCQQCHWK